MKAIGYYLIVEKEKQGVQKTEHGLLIAENAREDIRYAKASVISAGADIVGIKAGDAIYYDMAMLFITISTPAIPLNWRTKYIM
jgi:co-chaperonin GroES (HSP10)